MTAAPAPFRRVAVIGLAGEPVGVVGTQGRVNGHAVDHQIELQRKPARAAAFGQGGEGGVGRPTAQCGMQLRMVSRDEDVAGRTHRKRRGHQHMIKAQ